MILISFLLGIIAITFSVVHGVYEWRRDETLKAIMVIMAGISVAYLTIFLPAVIYLWPTEKYGDPPFFNYSFILFITNTLALGVLSLLSLLNYIEGNTNTEKWNGD